MTLKFYSRDNAPRESGIICDGVVAESIRSIEICPVKLGQYKWFLC